MPLGLSLQELGHVARTMAERLEQLAHTPEPGAAEPRSPQPGDLRIATEDSTFGLFERRWGVPLIDGGTLRLPRLIGLSRALDMILTGRSVGAAEALQWGLANRVVPKGQARAEAQKLAREIARFPQTCLRADRMSAHRQWDFDLAEALQSEGRGGYRPLVEEARAGATRFASGAGRHGSFERL